MIAASDVKRLLGKKVRVTLPQHLGGTVRDGPGRIYAQDRI